MDKLHFGNGEIHIGLVQDHWLDLCQVNAQFSTFSQMVAMEYAMAGADPEGGGRGRTPTLFCAKFFKKSTKLA